MPLVQVKGRTYFENNGKRYVVGGKPFEKLINAERQKGNRLFETLRIGGITYAPNPLVSGKGSRSALIELETTIGGKLTKRGEKKLETIDKQWLDKLKLLTVYVGEDIDKTIYDIWRAVKDESRVRIIFGTDDIDTGTATHQSFRNLFRVGGDSDAEWLVGPGDKIVVVKPSQIEAKKLFQNFRDGIQHCVFTPILERLRKGYEEAKTDGSKKRYQQRIKRQEKYEQEYPKGVPEDKMEEIASAAGLRIYMDIMGKPQMEWNTKGQIGSLYVTNIRENHIEGSSGVLVVDKDFDIVSEDEMKEKWEEAKLMENGKYKVEGDIKNGIPRKLHFLHKAFKVANPERDIINDFSNSITLKQYKLNATKYPEVNEFMKLASIINGWSTRINDITPTGCVDMPKAYAQFKKCAYYAGFLGSIHQWATGDFDYNFIKKHIGIYRFNIKKSSWKLARAVGLREGMSVHLPSVEIQYYMDKGIEGTIDAGVWGSRMDFEFTEEMLQNKRYQIWCGLLGSEQTHKRYTFPGSSEWAGHLAATIPEAKVDYWKDKGLITVRMPLYKVRTAHHIFAFITSYTRIQMMEAMSEFKHEQLCRVVLDGIYYTGEKPECLNGWTEKKLCKETSNNPWYTNIKMNINWPAPLYINNTLIAGQGGAGKTFDIQMHPGFNNILYVVPQHTLGQDNSKKYKVRYATIHSLLGAETIINDKKVQTRSYLDENGIPPVIVIDEITMIPAGWIDKAIEMYPKSLILLIGDIDKNGQWFQTRNSDGSGAFSKIWNPSKSNLDYVYKEGDRRSRDDEIKQLKLKCREVMREIFTDGDSGEDFVMQSWAKHNLPHITEDAAVAMFKPGDTWIAGTHAINKRLLEKGVVSGYYKKGGWISTEEKTGYEKRASFTIHSYQGSTIESGKVFISITNLFEYTMLYTAISRAVNYNQLVFVL